MIDTLTLHQLRALMALLEERNVTRAAARLGVSQPAMSHTLRSLRENLGDPLLVSGRGGLVRTARAETLYPALGRLMRELDQALLGPSGVDPGTWERRFTVAAWDWMTLSLVPGLLSRMRAETPGCDLDLRPVPSEGAAAALEDGRLDLSIEVRPQEAPGLRQRALREDNFACVVRQDHPEVGKTLDLDTFLRLPHALISPQGEGSGVVDSALLERGLRRRVVLRIRFFLAAPLVVARSDLVLTGPRSLCEELAALAPLRVLEPPLPLPCFRIHMVWHERNELDPAHRWLREAVAALL